MRKKLIARERERQAQSHSKTSIINGLNLQMRWFCQLSAGKHTHTEGISISHIKNLNLDSSLYTISFIMNLPPLHSHGDPFPPNKHIDLQPKVFLYQVYIMNHHML